MNTFEIEVSIEVGVCARFLSQSEMDRLGRFKSIN